MPQKKQLDKEGWDKLPEYQQGDYVEKDGQYTLKEVPADPGASKDRERLETIRKTADANARKVEALQAIVDKLPKDEEGNPLEPEQLTEIIAAYQETKQTVDKVPDKVKEAVDRAVKEARKKWDKEKGAVDAELAEERAASHDLVVVNTVNSWVGENIVPKHQKAVTSLLLSELNPEVEKVVENGKPSRRAVTKVSGFPESLKTYLDETWKVSDIAKEYLRAPDNSGGDNGDGSQPKPEGAVPTVTAKSQFKSMKERSDFIDKNGEEAYGKLPA